MVGKRGYDDWEDRRRRGFDCQVCRGTGRTVHSDMPDGSSRAQTCLACKGTGRAPAPETEQARYGALVIETRGPWAEDERPGLAEIRAVTDWGPWAQHNFPCPVCKERPAIVDLAGWVFGPCPGCAARGWELSCGRKRWWKRLTRR